MTNKRLAARIAALAAIGMLVFVPTTPVFAQSDASTVVGVEVEATIPPTTQPPPTTTEAPATTTTTAMPEVTTTFAPVTAASVPPTSTTSTTSTTAVPAAVETPPDLPTAPIPLVERPPAVADIPEVVKEAVVAQANKSIVGQARAAAKVARNFFSEVAAGTPVADVVQAILPAPVATVVVPAVRTASTFAFPIGLAFAVLAFLILQQRIDSTDPKLTAAPMAHEDEGVRFE